MYAWLWHRLPGPLPVRVAVAAAAVLAVLACCALWLYPAVAGALDGDGTVAPLGLHPVR